MMKNNNNNDFVIKPEDVKLTGETFSQFYANYLKENPRKLAAYKKYIIDEYNKTKDISLFLAGLEIVAKAQKKKSAKVEKVRTYRSLSQKNDPRFSSLRMVANDLGIDFMACSVK
jgi:DNA-binding phage protein